MRTQIKLMRDVIVAIQEDLPKIEGQFYGWKSAAKRVRKNTLTAEKLFKEFRKLSVAAAGGEE